MMNQICIPINHQEASTDANVIIFPDEIPTESSDFFDLIDVLRGYLAPLKVWRSIAVSQITKSNFIWLTALIKNK
jgi:hypothetical protein